MTIFHAILVMFYYTMWAEVVAVTVLSIVRPDSPEFLSSLFTSSANTPIYSHYSTRLASTIFQAYLFTLIAQIWHLLGGTMLLFMFTMSDSVMGGAPLRNSKKFSKDQAAEVRMELKRYRCLGLLTDEFNGVYSQLSGQIHAIIMTCIVLCIYGAVRTEGVMGFLYVYMSVWGLVSYLQIVNNYANIHRGSKDFLVALGASSRTAGTVASRDLRNLKELRIKAGSSAFYFDKELVLTVVGVILTQSINLLILH